MSSSGDAAVAGATATAAAAAAIQVGDNEKCSFRSCKVKGAEKLECAASECAKLCHVMCFQGLLLQKLNLPPLPDGRIACTKKCYTKAQKELGGGGQDQEGGRSGKWDSDGKNGPEDRHTSIRILLDWWTTEGNYSKFCGKHNEGIKKKQYAETLANKMSEETISKRDSKNALNKIQHIEKKWREAHNFATSETGAGIQESDGATTFENLVKAKCPHYYELLEIMQDRASSAPKVTNYEEEDWEVQSVSSIGNDEATAASSGKKAKRPAKKTTSILDDESVAALKVSTEAQGKRLEEIARHNKAMEDMEQQRLKVDKEKLETLKVSKKRQKLDYTMELLEKYDTMKEKGLSEKKILRLVPDMKEVIEAKAMDSDGDSDSD